MEIVIGFILLVLAIYIAVNFNNDTPRVTSLKTTSKTENRELVGNYMSDFEVVGVHVKDRKWYVINHVIEHNPVELVPEPTNKFSKDAIMVEVNGVHVGYISEDDVDEVHEIIKGPHQARVLLKDYTNGYLTLKIEINHK